MIRAAVWPGRDEIPDWNRGDVAGRDRLPARAYRIPFPDQPGCRNAIADNRRRLSPYILQLNGNWDTREYGSLTEVPENILSHRAGFNTRRVPETGQSDPLPIPPDYAFDPFRVGNDQPVLVCRRNCRLPLGWGGLRKRLILQGIGDACHIFVNSRFVGYVDGRGLPAEFDVTLALHEGENEIFLLLYPNGGGSYLDVRSSQTPRHRLWGLIRDLWLEATPPVAIDDVQVSTVYLPERPCWLLQLDLQVTSSRISMDSPELNILLRSGEETLLEDRWPVQLMPPPEGEMPHSVQSVAKLHLELPVDGVLAWTDETPQLYDLYLSLADHERRETFAMHLPVGFRELSRRDNQLLINGSPLQLRAVLWDHLAPPELSAATDLPALIRLLRRWKNCRLNAICFTSDPPDPIVLELCDLYGFYVIEQVPVRLDPLWDEIASDDRLEQKLLEQAISDRLTRLIRRDRNHPSILFWGAELINQKADTEPEWMEQMRQFMIRRIRSEDPGRWLNGVDLPNVAVPFQTVSTNAPLPFSDLLRQPRRDEHGRCLYRIGGGEQWLEALRHILRPVTIERTDPATGIFRIHNRLQWRALSDYAVDWQLLRDGRPLRAGSLDNIRTRPGESQFTEITTGELDFSDGSEYILRFELTRPEAGLWHRQGEPVSFQEFLLSPGRLPAPFIQRSTPLRVETSRHQIHVSGRRFWMHFSRLTGALESWRSGDRELIASPAGDRQAGVSGLHPTFARMAEPLDFADVRLWKRQGFGRMCMNVLETRIKNDSQSAQIEFDLIAGGVGQPADYICTLRYDIRGDGSFQVNACLNPRSSRAIAPPGFSLAWHTRNRNQFLFWLGADEQRTPARLTAIGPTMAGQARIEDVAGRDEPGSFGGVRWLRMVDEIGNGLRIDSLHKFRFDVRNQNPGGWLRDPPSQDINLIVSPLSPAYLQILAETPPNDRQPFEPIQLSLQFLPIAGRGSEN